MSAKNRAFALAIGTAALVALSAPVASAASFAGPSGFNGDSIVNTSGNQLPLQACNNDIPINAGALAGQLPLSDISAILGLANSGPITSSASRTCGQTPSQTVTSSTTTSSKDSTSGTKTWDPSTTKTWDPSDNTSGFNNDSIINTSNNQVPLQLCNNDIPVNAGLGAVQVQVDGVSGALGLLNSGALSSTADRVCGQVPTQDNSSTLGTSSSS
jgi:hypothetical protein